MTAYFGRRRGANAALAFVCGALILLLAASHGYTAARRGASSGRAIVTTYCKFCSGTITASGKRPSVGRTIAADWACYPRGSVVSIAGVGRRVVEDNGGAVPGRHFDVYVSRCPGPYKSQKKNCWHGTGTRKGVKFSVVKWGRR